MKKTFLVLFLSLLLLPLASFDSQNLVGHPMPLIANKTLDGKVVNENYFKRHVTIVSFMYIGCMPCMNEISVLNRLNREFSPDPRFQIICVARQTKEQMMQFNSDDKTLFGKIRKALNTDSIEYAILPACSDEKSKMDSSGNHITMKSECNTITEKYGIDAFPTTFFLDKKGIIRKIDKGGPPDKNDTLFYAHLKEGIDVLLNE